MKNETFADVSILRYGLDGFAELSLQQKLLIYCLAEASLCGRDIVTDQFGRWNLLVRTTLETIYLHTATDRNTAEFFGHSPQQASQVQHFETYLKQVWFANGIYHHYSGKKFTPQFSADFLRERIGECEHFLHETVSFQSPEQLFQVLQPIIFDATCYPQKTNQRAGDDLVTSSAVNYYEGVTQEEAEHFYEKLSSKMGTTATVGLNSRLVKEAVSGTIGESVWKIGGEYSPALEHVVDWLEHALQYAETSQQHLVIQLLIDYYRTGDLGLFDRYSIEWVKENEATVDFINGFIESYADPLGLKGSWEGIVHYIDKQSTQRAQTVCEHAMWFEQHSPVNPVYRKEQVVGISARAVNAAMLGGDEYPSTAIGINLPNNNWIRATYGSKSISIANISQAYAAARKGSGFYEEFIPDAATRELVLRYGEQTDLLHTDLHECLGHGSGRLMPGVSPTALKVYADVVEEARADLYALYFMADDYLLRIGLLPNGDAYKAQYYTYLLNGAMTQLTRIEPHHTIEEAHMRARAVIARWVLDQYPQAAALVKADGQTQLQVKDYAMLREAFGNLLAEIQRIKSEGLFDEARKLVEKYGVTVPEQLHGEVLRRYASLHIQPYTGFLNPHLHLQLGKDGRPQDVYATYDETFAQQMLRYSKQYAFLKPTCPTT